MYRNSTVGFLPLGLSRRLLAPCCSLIVCLLVFCGLALFGGLALNAQSTSGGGIQGTVLDPDGRPVAGATVTMTNTDTGVQTTKQSGSAGNYSIQPLPVGTYNLEVTAKGFQRLLQENINVDNASVVGYNPKLVVGGESTTVTVTDAPAYLDTTDSTLGGTIENELYSQLPLSMNGGPRDPTAFQYLMPGVQENPADTGNVQNSSGQYTTAETNGNSGIYGGSGQTNLNENYINGVPVSNISQQGSSNPVSTAVSVDAVDQFSVQTSGASVSFSGAGSTNYTIKSGGNQFHGTVFDFIRNTDFDTWGYFSKVPQTSGFAEKPGEHQNSYGGSMGGPILKDKFFFFGSYEGYHYTKISNTPQYISIPTVAERTGNFTDLMGNTVAGLYDPVTGSLGARAPFEGLFNGVPTYNVIPTSEISSISNYLQGMLPTPTNLSTFNNYLAALPQENADYSIDARLDYTFNSRNKFSLVGVGGTIGYGTDPFYTTYNQLPTPYAAGQYLSQKTATGILQYVFIASQSLINSLSYGFTRNWGEGFSLTANKTSPQMPNGESSLGAGITNLPPGGASQNMPAVSFSAGYGPNTNLQNWQSTSSTGPQGTNTYTIIDNLQWIRGRHNITFGAQVQWLETNGGSFGGYSQSLSLTYSGDATNFCIPGTTGLGACPSSVASGGNNGYDYASFLVGAVNNGSVKTQDIQDVGGRYRPMSPYVQDNWQVSPKLTLNLGLRYDYLQPYHEVKDRISFLDVNVINPIVGIPGVLEYAGFPNINNFPAQPPTASLPQGETSQQLFDAYSPYICHCTTPVHPYNKNFEPRLGFAYAYTPTLVFSGAYSMTLTHAGGAGGNVGATAGTGNNGEYGASSSWTSPSVTSDPGFFLNPGLTAPPNAIYKPPVQGSQPPAVNGVLGPNICNNSLPCELAAIPPWTVPSIAVNPLSTTGDYYFSNLNPANIPSLAGLGLQPYVNNFGCQTSDNLSCAPQGLNFADPYYGDRGPEFISYNFNVQKMINKKAVLSVAYAGSQTHFLPGGSGRGPATNAISPDYSEEYGGALEAGCSGLCTLPYPLFGGQQATLAQSLRPFPQYGTLTDLWGDTGNANYNSLQIQVTQRPWHNLSGFMNYTRAKEIDDTGVHRTQYPVGPQDGNFIQNYSANRIDRALGTANQTNAVNVTWTYTFPIGRGQQFFATNRIAGLIGGGWQFSGIYKYRDGYPLTVASGAACGPNTAGLQGTCMPDYTPGFNKSQARINGRWGRGPGANAGNLNSISYLNSQGFQCPDSGAAGNSNTESCGFTYKLGNVGRTAPYGLTGPGWWDMDLGLRRTFVVRETASLNLTFQFEADVTNATNSTFFNLSSSTWDTSGFGYIRGQNLAIQPRDWQFAGRFRF